LCQPIVYVIHDRLAQFQDGSQFGSDHGIEGRRWFQAEELGQREPSSWRILAHASQISDVPLFSPIFSPVAPPRCLASL
jgi:hypothetical protein